MASVVVDNLYFLRYGERGTRGLGFTFPKDGRGPRVVRGQSPSSSHGS